MADSPDTNEETQASATDRATLTDPEAGADGGAVSPQEAADGEAPEGEPAADEAAAIEAADGELTDGELTDGELTDGELEDGELAEGDLVRGTADLRSIVEALIFASPEPLTPKALMKLLDTEPKEDVLAALEGVKADYQRVGGLQIVEVANGYQIVTRPDLHEWVRRLFHERSTQKLSVQALETLAVIAYRQPITALEITEIRGVSASGVLNTLLERHLIKIVGRKQVVGRPFMYATTKEFLIRFGLKDLSDLPKVEDMAESLGIESPLLVEQTLPEEQLPLSEPDESAVSDVSAGEADDVADEHVGEDEEDGGPRSD